MVSIISTKVFTVKGSDMEATATTWVLVDMEVLAVDMEVLAQAMEALELAMVELEVLTELGTEGSVLTAVLALTEGSVLTVELAITVELEVMELATELTIKMRINPDTTKVILATVMRASTKLVAIKAITQALEDTTADKLTMLMVGLEA